MSRRRRKSRTSQQTGFKPIKLAGRTPNQVTYIQEIRRNEVILCAGPAGSGKTHIAVGSAVQALKAGRVEKIVLCRPVVDVGNSIGYLPGDLEAKVGPYLTPLFDELAYYVELKHVSRLMEEGKIEICPLSMMRGRTFNNCFVIFDEAQNATVGELRMFLTRIGLNTKMVLVGDLNQSDLPPRLEGGFRKCVECLDNLEGVAVVNLHDDDIVRHHLISYIQARLEENND